MIAAIGGGYQTVRESLDARAYPPPGQLIDVGGHRLHLYCTGSGSPTVVLEPGHGASSSDFAWITPAVARDTTVRVYDRAGRGWSDATDGPQDGAHIAADLHTLLERADIPGPYVLAGHSFGGLYVQSFAAQFPDQVAGMVLLDSTAPKPRPRPASNTDPYNAIGRVAALSAASAHLGAGRLLNPFSYTTLPPRSRDEARANPSTAGHLASFVEEYGVANTSMQQASALTSLDGKPLIVLTADEGSNDPQWQAKQEHMATPVDQQSPPARERHPRFAPLRRSRRCRSQPGNPRRRHRGTHRPPARPALTRDWSWRHVPAYLRAPGIVRMCGRCHRAGEGGKTMAMATDPVCGMRIDS